MDKTNPTLYSQTGTLTPRPPFDFSKSLEFLGLFTPTKDEQILSWAKTAELI
jgi:hypothetical protein